MKIMIPIFFLVMLASINAMDTTPVTPEDVDVAQKPKLVMHVFISKLYTSGPRAFFRDWLGITGQLRFYKSPYRIEDEDSPLLVPEEILKNLKISWFHKPGSGASWEERCGEGWKEMPFPGFKVPPHPVGHHYKFVINSDDLPTGYYKAVFRIEHDEFDVEYTFYTTEGSIFSIMDAVDDDHKAMMIYEDLFYRRDFMGEDAFKERVMSLLNGDELEEGYKLNLIGYLFDYSPVISYGRVRNHVVIWLLSQKYSSEYRRSPSIPVYIALHRDIWDRIVKDQKEIKTEANDLARKYFPKIEPEYNINKIDFKKIEQEELSNFEKYPDSRPTSKATTPTPDATTTP